MENINENIINEEVVGEIKTETIDFKTSKEIDKIFPALVNFHKNIESIKMTATNPFFSSKYASLPDILSNVNPILAENDLFIMQIPTNANDEEMKVHTRIIHSSGQYVKADTVSLRKAKDAQQVVAFSTYMRRAAISSLLALCFDTDDDGNSISEKGDVSSPSTESPTSSRPRHRR